MFQKMQMSPQRGTNVATEPGSPRRFEGGSDWFGQNRSKSVLSKSPEGTGGFDNTVKKKKRSHSGATIASIIAPPQLPSCPRSTNPHPHFLSPHPAIPSNPSIWLSLPLLRVPARGSRTLLTSPAWGGEQIRHMALPEKPLPKAPSSALKPKNKRAKGDLARCRGAQLLSNKQKPVDV